MLATETLTVYGLMRFFRDDYLARFPYIGKSYASISEGLRGMPLMGYIIFYQVVDEGIEILRVVSGYRNIEQVLGEE